MKKTTTILCLGIALCMLGCSDDDDQVTTTSTVPFSLLSSTYKCNFLGADNKQ